MEGVIPISLANMSNLQMLDLSNNSLHGSVPSLGSLANLRQLVLARTLLESHDWLFLTSLANCTELTKLSLEGNALNGSLPLAVVNLSTRLGDLSLGSNQILGSIPAEISNLVNLTSLRMESNLLSGSIPSTIGKLRYLYILSLSKNKLSGQIPPSVGNITQLGKIYLDANNLIGNIPSSLGQCKGLLELNLSRNNLNGSIPVELFDNSPLSLGLDFSHNNLTGELPLGFWGGGPVSLHMEGNKFHGEIPAIWNLVWTQQINLSHNDLNGTVPEFFAFMTVLEQLDLSHNNLEGAVPTTGIFENTAAVVLDGNKGLCSNSSMLALPLPLCPGISASVTKTKHHLSLLATLLLIILPPLTIGLLVLLWFLPNLWKKGVFSFSQWDVLSKILSCFAHHKRRVQAAPCHDEKKLKRVSYQDILKATNCFSSVHTISSTCTGSVYVGRFKSDRSLVAIKVFNLNEPGGYDSYFIECEVLRSTRHRNIMRPVTLCSTLDSQNHEFKALIFKFMVNGSLEKWLHSGEHNGIPNRVLSFGQRICIAADVASALDYVHNQLTPPLIHCDLKPQNILLDDDMTAQLSDFGSAKFLSPGLVIPKSLDDVGGTIGYMAPGESAFHISHLIIVCPVHILYYSVHSLL
jgi:Leucine-rich repeat (LRR) protein